MLLLAYGIYVLASGTLRVSPRYGAEGRGARAGGVICVVAGLALQLALSLSGVAFDLTLFASMLALFVVVPLALVLVVHVYGNAYAESSQTTLYVREVPEPGTSDPEERRMIDEARRRGDRLRRIGLVLIGIVAGGVLAAIVGGLFSGGLVTGAQGAVYVGFPGLIPLLIGVLLLVRARGFAGDARVLEARAGSHSAPRIPGEEA